MLLALQNPWKAESAWFAQFAESWYHTRLTSGFGYSQNQSQGIELDVHKEVCAEIEGIMGSTEVITDGWLYGEDATGRGGLVWSGMVREEGQAVIGGRSDQFVSNITKLLYAN